MIGVDILAEWDDDHLFNNFGLGKRYPGLSLYGRDGKEVPVLFAATPNASMDGNVLKQTFEMMDDNGISQRGTDSNGKKYVPFFLLDGHVSRIDEGYLRYINDESHEWDVGVGAPYGTSHWQFHDDKRQNGTFKSILSKEKSAFFRKKRSHGLPAELLPQEIVIVAQSAIMKSFMRLDWAQSALAHRGHHPYNRAPLDDPQILATAPDETQKERTRILRSRGVDNSVSMPAPPTQRDLLTTGSGHLAGGLAAAAAVSESIGELNHTGQTADDLLTLMQNEKSKSAGRRRTMDTSGVVSAEELKKRYAQHRRFTTGVVFGQGDAKLGPEVRDRVISLNAERRDKEEAKANRKKDKMRELADAVQSIRYHQETDPSFILRVTHLEKLVRWKRNKDDSPLKSKRKEHLLERWEKTKGRRSPHVSPCSSDAEDGDGDDGRVDNGDDDWGGDGDGCASGDEAEAADNSQSC